MVRRVAMAGIAALSIMCVNACSSNESPPAPCATDDEPGLRLSLDLLPNVSAGGPGYFTVTYSNGLMQSLFDDMPPLPWSGHVDGVAPYAAGASAGAARVSLDTRPDPGVVGDTEVTIDLARCSTAHLIVRSLIPDGGVASP